MLIAGVEGLRQPFLVQLIVNDCVPIVCFIKQCYMQWSLNRISIVIGGSQSNQHGRLCSCLGPPNINTSASFPPSSSLVVVRRAHWQITL